MEKRRMNYIVVKQTFVWISRSAKQLDTNYGCRKKKIEYKN